MYEWVTYTDVLYRWNLIVIKFLLAPGLVIRELIINSPTTRYLATSLFNGVLDLSNFLIICIF